MAFGRNTVVLDDRGTMAHQNKFNKDKIVIIQPDPLSGTEVQVSLSRSNLRYLVEQFASDPPSDTQGQPAYCANCEYSSTQREICGTEF